MGVPPTEEKGSLGRVIKLESRHFLESSTCEPLKKKYKDTIEDTIRLFLECVYIHHDDAPKDLDGAELRKIVLDTLPRRFTGDEDYLASVPQIVAGYFEHLRTLTKLADPKGVDEALEEMRKSFTRITKKLKPEERLTREEAVGQIRRPDDKVGRNDPCPCGSGKKYKKCCQNKEKA